MQKSTLGNKQIMATNIKRYLDKLGLNTKEFSEKLGFKYTTVLDWVNAKTYPRIDKIEKMANFFGVEKSELVEEYSLANSESNNLEWKELFDTFNQLDKKNKKRVVDYADSQLKAQQYSKINDTPVYYEVTLYGAVSAGTGEWLQDEHKETISVTQKPPLHDFAVRVNGDSMLPLFVDGQIVYVNKIDDDSDIHSNQIVIAELNGNAYLKKLILNSTGCSLVSLNPKYKDIQISESDNFRVAGVVVF